jgi:hypothetical protein
MYQYKITKRQIELAVQKKFPSGLSVYDFNNTCVSVDVALRKQELAQFTPNLNKEVFLYRQSGALGIASHWSYTRVESLDYEIIGYYAANESERFLERGLENWKDIKQIK